MTADLLVDRPRPGVLHLRLNRPSKLNAITDSMLDDLSASLAAAESDTAVRAVVLSGEGRAFCAGADIGGLHASDPATFRATIDRFMAFSAAMQAFSKPVIAALHGYVMAGGFELAVLCDVRIAAEGTKLGLPDIAIGLSPTSGMTYLLPRLIGWSRAVDLTLSGRTIDTEEAERIGLVTQIVSAGQLIETALDYASTLASAPAVGVVMTKKLYRESMQGNLADALARETDAELACFAEPETQARFKAFLERRR
ncbi:MAG: enoyl-CoA hydratase/isomerase family protein [Hyphomicrobiaceae bacterium]